ncbi:MAG: hypothetical protein ACRD38_00870 [Nitrososphaerales archaeon]
MNKRETMLASIAAVTVIVAILLVSGIFGKAIAFNPTGAPDYTVPPSLGVQLTDGSVTKIIVEINSPFGFERITSFQLFQTENMMKKTGYYTLRLFGHIYNDKRTLLNWIHEDLGTLPPGLYTELPITTSGSGGTGGGKPARMSVKPVNTTITTVPMSGTIKLQLLENRQDLYLTGDKPVREFVFSGCHVAGYFLGTDYDDRKAFFRDGMSHFEEVDFACTKVKDMNASSMDSRGITVDTAMNNDGREIMNEKGELIINSREYRQPIVMDNEQEEETSAKQEIAATAVTDKTYYEIDEPATFTVTFTDLEGNKIDPDTIRAYYDGKMIELEQHDIGVYTYTTLGLTKEHHQLIVSAEKEDFATDTIYLSIPMHRIS